ncbi:hypothetical protein OE88DRAFT_1408077 [Heliocybe sulcata]|uniref:Uncharacterized protein n=1 Tax=Heliocybe sulcata TaxID=5364 RepID=A0A5C3NG33_9AGAM|nr:hypothetical protein OE88DRAFT_1408077 [Heliocybe sulcata]
MILLGDFIALPIIHDLRSIHSVILINWTTGESRLVRIIYMSLHLVMAALSQIRPASGLGRSVRTAHICFLSGRRLMTVDDRRPALDLYGCDNDTWDNVQHIAVLDLPHYRHYSISAAILTSSINSDTKCVYPSLRGFSPGFYPAPHRAALVALQLRFMPHAYNLDQDTKNYTIIICVPAMLDIIHQVRGETDVRIPTTIQWETWGASCTRWFGHLAPLHQLRMYGYRVVLPNRILDFNPLDIAIDLAIDEATWSAQSSAPGLGRGRPNSTRSGDASENIVTESSVIPQMNLFYQNISTRLLYRETVLERSLPFADLYPNHGIVGLEVSKTIYLGTFDLNAFAQTDRMRHINALHFLTV